MRINVLWCIERIKEFQTELEQAYNNDADMESIRTIEANIQSTKLYLASKILDAYDLVDDFKNLKAGEL